MVNCSFKKGELPAINEITDQMYLLISAIDYTRNFISNYSSDIESNDSNSAQASAIVKKYIKYVILPWKNFAKLDLKDEGRLRVKALDLQLERYNMYNINEFLRKVKK
jgi:hypothetical protein